MDYYKCQDLSENVSSNLDNDNTSLDHIPYPFPVELWRDANYVDFIKLFFSVLIVIGGFLGNLSIILTVACNKSMRSTINFYIANLATADFMICIVCMIPHAISVMTVDNFYPLGEFMCKFNPFTQMVCLVSSVLTLSAISCDRSMAVLFPVHKRITKQRTSMVVIVIWTTSLLLSIPILFFKEHRITKWQNFVQYECMTEWPSKEYYEGSVAWCIRRNPLHASYTIILSVVLFFLPVAVMIIAYTLIMLRLRLSHVPGEQHDGILSIQSKSRKRVNKMVFIVLLVFIICWMPLEVLYLRSIGYTPGIYFSPPEWSPDLKWFSEYIAYSNSFFNPIIYGWFNKTFREGFFALLICRYRRDGCIKPGSFENFRTTSTSSRYTFKETFQNLRSSLSLKRWKSGFFSEATRNIHMQQAQIKETEILD